MILPTTKTPGAAPTGELDGARVDLHGDVQPAWIGIPDNLGGGRATVTDTTACACPSCERRAVRYLTDRPVDGGVIAAVECATCQVFWWAAVTP